MLAHPAHFRCCNAAWWLKDGWCECVEGFCNKSVPIELPLKLKAESTTHAVRAYVRRRESNAADAVDGVPAAKQTLADNRAGQMQQAGNSRVMPPDTSHAFSPRTEHSGGSRFASTTSYKQQRLMRK